MEKHIHKYIQFNYLYYYYFTDTRLGVTILLSLTVFLNLVAESMPTTSDAVPLIGIYSIYPHEYTCSHVTYMEKNKLDLCVVCVIIINWSC